MAVKAQWTYPVTQHVYDLAHNSGNDAYHTVIAYLRTVFMPSDIAQGFGRGGTVPQEHALVPLFNASKLQRNIDHYGKDPKAPKRKADAPPGPSKRFRGGGDSGSGSRQS